MAERSRPFATALLFGLLATAAPPAWSDASRQWNFQVTLDGQPIGEHRFMSTASGDDRQVSSDASFVVKMLGLAVYRYRHQAIEQWRGNCLTGLAATTEENGRTTRVRAEAEGTAALQADNAQPLVGCVMSFAYWNPAILTQNRLFNAQTGRAETVQVKQQGSDTVEVRGVPVTAARWRITGTTQPIDLWYAADGEWIGLDSTVSTSRRLSYRLK
jgi:hypothetical protein